MKDKAQILALTIFLVLVILASNFVLLMPINHQLVRIRRLIDTFRALSYAESGVELGNYYALKRGNLLNFGITSNYYNFNNSPCFEYAKNINDLDFNRCYVINMVDPNSKINITMYSNIKQESNNAIRRIYVKVFGNGNVKNSQRVLDFDFLP